jgi:hypothetical protein
MRGRCKKDKQAKTQIQDNFALVARISGGKHPKRFLKAVASTEFQIFPPLASHIELKKACVDAAVGFVEELDNLVAKVKAMIERNALHEEINEQLRKIDSIEIHIAETGKALAWRSKTLAWRSNGDAWDKHFVICDYFQEWINYAGYLIVSHYMCICGTLVCSKMWPRLRNEIDRPGQRYYCPSCVRRYRPGFGQIVEIMTPDRPILYARAVSETSTCVCDGLGAATPAL